MRIPICVVLAWMAAQAPVPDAASGIVKGRLTYGDTGEAAAHLTLHLLNRRGAMVARTDTETDGHFRFNVPPGVYRLDVQLPGDQVQYIPGTLGAEGTDEEGLVVRVRVGAELLVDYALKAGGALGGRVFDPEGRPLKDGTAVVAADPRDNGGAQIETHGSASIDAEGHFLVSGLTAGLYRVIALPPDRQSPDGDGHVMLPTYYPGRLLPSEAQPVAVGIGDRFDGLTMTMVRGVSRSITGRVIDPDGSPAANRAVILLHGTSHGTSQNLSSATTRTDEQGRFTVAGLTAGSYECAAVGRASSNEWGSLVIDVGLDDVRDLVVQIQPAVRLSGHVEFEEDTHPIADMRVWTSRIAIGPAATYGDVRPDGSFAFVLSATRRIEVQRVPEGWYLKAIWIGGANAMNTFVDAQSARSPITIVLGRRMAGLTGHVDDAGESDTVLAIADDPLTWTPGSSQLAVAELDQHGDFRFDHLLAGGYRLAVVPHIPSGFRRADQAVLSSLSASGVHVRLEEGAPQQVTLKAPGSGR